jgi:hypothetical protein
VHDVLNEISLATAEAGRCWDVPRLLQQFESLGENCDLGVVQRAAGLEPFGLFRFAACDAPGVIALLRARCEPLGEPADLRLEEVGARREYFVRSRHFAFEMHTNRYAPQDEAAVVRQGEIEKLRYLKSHLLRDLKHGGKLFVFKGSSEPATIHELAAQLQDYGDNCLLWVDIADAAHAPGSVERDSPALLRGYVSRFGTYDGGTSLPVEEWVSVCARAYRLWRNEAPPQTSVVNLLARAASAGSCEWHADAPALTRTLIESGSVIYEHHLTDTKPARLWQAHLPIDRGGRFVFSAWIRLPHGCGLDEIGLLLTGFPTTGGWRADRSSRGRWQRAWVSAALPEDARVIACELNARGAPDAVLHSARWCLERGTRPSGYGFAL